MQDLVNEIFQATDLVACTAEMRILTYMFVFTFIITTTCSIIQAIKNMGK